jgi:hypothetical protein
MRPLRNYKFQHTLVHFSTEAIESSPVGSADEWMNEHEAFPFLSTLAFLSRFISTPLKAFVASDIYYN